MVIAGFAAGGGGTHLGDTPLDLVIASVLRRRFAPCGEKWLRHTTGGKTEVICADEVPGGRPEGVSADSTWAERNLARALTGVASLTGQSSPPPFWATFAGIEKDGKVVLRQQFFSGSWVQAPAQNTPIPDYRVEETPIVTVQKFTPVIAGIPYIGRMVLDGLYKTSDPSITNYYRKLHDQPALDSMSLAEMAGLARAILRKTEGLTEFVGGPDQIGIFPVSGEPEWNMPTLPPDPAPQKLSLLPRFFFNECLAYTKDGRSANGPCTQGKYAEDWQHPFEETISQFFLGCRFEGVTVALDDNYFVRSQFDGVTFKYSGKTFLPANNTYTNCKVEFSEDAALPNGSEIFDRCEKVKVKAVSLDKDTIGKPAKIENVDGQIRIPIP